MPGPLRSVKPIRVARLLTPETVLVRREETEKDKLLEVLAARLCEKSGLSDLPGILATIRERENGISTTLDTGLSLPHVRLDGLEDIVGALATAARGIPDPKQPELVIRVMFLFFSPNKQEFFPLHLQSLRAVSSLFQPAFIDLVARAPDAAAVFDLIRGREG